MLNMGMNCKKMAMVGFLAGGLLLAATGAAYAGDPTQAGTENDPYLINELSDLVWMGNNVNNSSGKYYLMTANIDASDTENWNDSGTDTSVYEGFKPIGDENTPFEGHFNEGYFVAPAYITNLHINRATTDYVGLFGVIGESGQVQNLGIAGGSVVGSYGVGGLVGGNSGTLSTCYSTCDVTGNQWVGGLVGISSSTSTVSNCYATGTVESTGNVGGLIGENDGTMSNCYATGTVTSTDGDAGGLAAYNDGEMLYCYATGAVTSTYFWAGGLAGSNDSTVSYCYATGAVASVEYGAGGLVGGNCFSSGALSNCYATGTVEGNYFVGGLVGNSYFGTVSNCYSTGAVTGNTFVGGLVGDNDGGTVSSSYWDTQTSGQSTSDGGTGKTTAQMKAEATFVDWDFDDIWGIYEGVDYPYLNAFSGSPVTPSGSGTEQSPYLIANLGNLVWMGQNASSSSGKYYSMTADIDASDTAKWNDFGTNTTVLEGFNPIGDTNSLFSGDFDGNGHIIAGLVINRQSASFQGLFGKVDETGYLHNLGIVGSDVTGDIGVGTLVGDCYGTVSNCYATGTVTADDSGGGLVGRNRYVMSNCYASGAVTGDDRIGGLVGFNDGEVSNCYATGAVEGDDFIGGLIGSLDGHQLESPAEATVSNSYATGAVTGDSVVGGLVGIIWDATVTNCYSIGEVTGTSYVGGLIGYDQNDTGTVTCSYWDTETSEQSTSDGGTGKTTVQMKQKATFVDWDFEDVWGIEEDVTYPFIHALGIVPSGTPYQIANLGNLAWMSNNARRSSGKYYLMTADIDASDTANWNDPGTSTSPLEGFKPIGDWDNPFEGDFDGDGHTITGLVINRADTNSVGLFDTLGEDGHVHNLGIVQGAVTGNEGAGGLIGANLGTVSNCYATGAITSNYSAGGLVSYNQGTVSNCYANCTVTTFNNVGGLIGSNIGTASNCYATGAVTGDSVDGCEIGGLVGLNYQGEVSNCYATGAVEGAFYVGGLVGENFEATVSNCYSTGAVTGDEENYAVYIGGLIGFNYQSTVSYSYWDTQTSGQSTSDGGTGKTTAQMKQEATFVNWDFDDDWGIVEDVTYPFLRTIAQAAVTPSGSGTEEDPYLIANLGNLVWMSDNVNSSSGKYYEMTANIDASQTAGWNDLETDTSPLEGFKPIGDENDLFEGDFNGNGHTISGLVVNRWDIYFVGLFGTVGENGNVHNLGVDGGSVAGGLEAGSAGGLIGANLGTVSNCYTTCAVTGDESVGGLVGFCYSATVSYCYSSGAVAGNYNVGGLIGADSGFESTVVSSYWDTQTSGLSYSAGGTGKTTTQMKQEATFVNWDFDDVWDITEDTTYPWLR